MHTSQKEVLAEIAHAIRQLRPSAGIVSPSTNIAQDLGLDSVEVMDFVMTLEDRFDISIPLDQIAQVETVADLCAAIENLKKTDAA